MRRGSWETTDDRSWLEQANDPDNGYHGMDVVPTLILFCIMGILTLCYLAIRLF